MQITILTAIFGRHKLARRWLEHYEAMRAKVADVADLRLVAVISKGDQVLADDLEAAGCEWLVHDNKPVSFKWQAGLTHVRQSQPDAVMFMGSDDFANKRYMLFALERAARGESFGLDHVWMWEAGRLGLWQGPLKILHESGRMTVPIGAGRVLSRAALESVNWTLWQRAQSIGLDSAASRRLAQCGVRQQIVTEANMPGAMIVDVKGADNLHKMSSFKFAIEYKGEAARERLNDCGMGFILEL